jgi:hypothetical protein
MDLLSKPKFMNDDKEWDPVYRRSANEDHTVELSCRAEGVPYVTVQWYKNGIQMTQNGSHLIDNATSRVYRYNDEYNIRLLTIGDIDMDDNGTYTCMLV